MENRFVGVRYVLRNWLLLNTRLIQAEGNPRDNAVENNTDNAKETLLSTLEYNIQTFLKCLIECNNIAELLRDVG